MDTRRFFSFLIYFFAFTYIFNWFIAPKLFPPPPPQVVPEMVEPDAADDAEPGAEDGDAAEAVEGAQNAVADAPVDHQPAVHPNQNVTLGSLDPTSGYFLEVHLSSLGAAIESVQLTDPKFKELQDESRQVTVIGTNTSDDRTFTTAVKKIDDQLKKHKLSLEKISWQLVEAEADHATFAFESPDQTLKVTKTYHLTKITGTPEELQQAFLVNPKGFTIQLDLTVTNLSPAASSVVYELQGPVGIVLENSEHSRKYRDIKVEFEGDDDAVTLGAKAVKDLYTQHLTEGQQNGIAMTESQVRQKLAQADAWTGAFRYVGVDVQFFAGLVAALDDRPPEERLLNRWIERTYPVMIQENLEDIAKGDISFRMRSTLLELGPAGAKGAADSVTHKFAFFVGPKRSDLLDPPPLEATQVLDYGWFGPVARVMHWILEKLYRFGLPYVFAIICLTALVRACMFPISRKQAVMAAKQKALAPKLAELKLKYGDDKEKFARAQMELWRKHGVNPLGGCLPAFIQLPVFIGLYTCLNSAVDLRLSKFLWIDNLAAPDALAGMPTLPFLGSEFNLLPCISVVLFLVQQKMFMPPPTDEQTAMTQKMMNMMTIVMGVMFWHVPAGLCIYFICSSVWGIAERKLLGADKISIELPNVVVKDPASKDSAAEPKRKPGFFGKLMDAVAEAQKKAEEAQKNAGKTPDKDNRPKGTSKKKNNKKNKTNKKQPDVNGGINGGIKDENTDENK